MTAQYLAGRTIKGICNETLAHEPGTCPTCLLRYFKGELLHADTNQRIWVCDLCGDRLNHQPPQPERPTP